MATRADSSKQTDRKLESKKKFKTSYEQTDGHVPALVVVLVVQNKWRGQSTLRVCHAEKSNPELAGAKTGNERRRKEGSDVHIGT